MQEFFTGNYYLCSLYTRYKPGADHTGSELRGVRCPLYTLPLVACHVDVEYQRVTTRALDDVEENLQMADARRNTLRMGRENSSELRIFKNSPAHARNFNDITKPTNDTCAP
eukprot:scaffold25786_cov81-Phaeocystis_antarctica.AAC.4